MTHIDGYPLPATARHDEHGNHIPPHIPEWRRAADSANPHTYDPNRVVKGSEIETDQRRRAAFAAHLAEHRRRGESTVVVEEF